MGNEKDGGSPCDMSLRDYFAGQALPALIAVKLKGLELTGQVVGTVDDTAEGAYKYADAMLARRRL